MKKIIDKSNMAKTAGSIILVIFFKINEPLLERLKHDIEKTFNTRAEVRTKVISLRSLFNVRRSQYSSSQLLSRLRKLERNPDDKILGIVDVDLFSPGWEFIFGEAEINTGTGTLSTFRLKPEKPSNKNNPDLLEKRLAKEAIHELGHLFGLFHCENPRCVMSFSTDLKYVDHKQQIFCSECLESLRKTN